MNNRQAQGTTLFTALLVLIGIGVVVQLWLLALRLTRLCVTNRRYRCMPPLDLPPFS